MSKLSAEEETAAVVAAIVALFGDRTEEQAAPAVNDLWRFQGRWWMQFRGPWGRPGRW
jgi:hypothetical protein